MGTARNGTGLSRFSVAGGVGDFLVEVARGGAHMGTATVFREKVLGGVVLGF